jgi:NAD(P)-dependent dehydrogenase (short-subunit alcohol dehydrogenase family)
MSTIDASELLRPGLLEGVSIVLAHASGVRASGADEGGESLGAAVRAACTELGARVSDCPLARGRSLELDDVALEDAVDRVLADAGSVDLLVVDGTSLFTSASVPAPAGVPAPACGRPEGARAALHACLDASWNVTRAVANRAFLPGERGGRIVYLAPAPDGGEHADAARAGLENLARTLSIEWARHGITAVTIAPGALGAPRAAGAPGAAGAARAAGAPGAAGAGAGEVAALTAYLASPAGAYFSGCLLDLRRVAGG